MSEYDKNLNNNKTEQLNKKCKKFYSGDDVDEFILQFDNCLDSNDESCRDIMFDFFYTQNNETFESIITKSRVYTSMEIKPRDYYEPVYFIDSESVESFLKQHLLVNHKLNWLIREALMSSAFLKTDLDAAAYGYIYFLRYLHNTCVEMSDRVCATAAMNGHFECLKFLHSNGCSLDYARNEAMKYGHFECMRYAYENGDEINLPHSMILALKSGNLDSVKFVIENKIEYNKQVVETTVAAENENIELLEFLLELGYKTDRNSMTACIKAGLEFMKLLFKYDKTLYEMLHSTACGYKGSVEKIKFLVDNKYPYKYNKYNSSLYAHAINHNNYDIVLYLFEQGFDFELKDSFVAVKVLDFKYIKFLIENGCTIDNETFYNAAKYNSIECMQILIDAKCPVDEWSYIGALESDNIENFKFLYEYGVKLKPEIYNHIFSHPHQPSFNGGEMFRYMRDHGCHHDQDAVMQNMDRPFISLVYIESGASFDEDEVVMYAVKNISKDSWHEMCQFLHGLIKGKYIKQDITELLSLELAHKRITIEDFNWILDVR